ncbi:zinc finger protein 703-like [Anneissia japonica]|uniref:zinc finger protein 703-like n=1 Tax=Anneissia japonica TaxID=1529436 RepID=UPI0014257BE3|nr:zinc finger protein 703-like [Anneissia japonica]
MKLVSNMLSSTRTQTYMHTEYLQPLDPLPSLDAKKSPLALLAQTCSSIGKPDPPHNNVDNKPVYESQNGKSSPEKPTAPIDDKCSSFKPYKQSEKREGDATIMKIGFPNNQARKSASSPPVNDSKPMRSNSCSPTLKPKAVSPIPSSHSTPDKEHSSHSGCDASREGLLKAVTTPLPALSTASHISYKHGHLSPTAAVAPCGCHSQIVGHIPCDPLSHKHHHEGHISPTSPYAAAYARVKTADGATTLMPICRDPYCTNCQQTPQINSSSCTQCRHDPIGVGLSGAIPVALPFGGALPAYPLPTSMSSAASYLYTPHPGLPPASTGDHVCNWVSGTTSCGKRFASSEELLQHLRSHTNETTPSSPLAASLSAQLGAYYMQYHPSAPALGLKSGHASPLSPVRYHPYRSSLTAPISALPSLPAGAYYSPYALHDLKARFATGIPH